MSINSYTENEIVLCTYAALYNDSDFGGSNAIHELSKRSLPSIRLKISNIAAMLDEENIPRNKSISPLTGTAKGGKARRTDWKIVSKLVSIDRNTLLNRCKNIIDNKNKHSIQNPNKYTHSPVNNINLNFIKSLLDVNLSFSQSITLRLLSSLTSKRFVILTGLAGSGKTKLAQAFSRWICPTVGEGEENPYYALVPVGADWMGNENILGYANGLESGKYVSKPALELILHAKDNPETPHFLILDEMNLSHVERYFADILSAIESEGAIPLHNADTMVTAAKTNVPASVALPPNLFIIGTVNVDETTYMFSPKVLDRANVIEFRMKDTELTAFLTDPKAPDLSQLDGKGEAFGKAFVDAAKDKSLTVPSEAQGYFKSELETLFKLLQEHNAEFGYRVAYEAARFFHFYKTLGGFTDTDTAWLPDAMDAVIVQKLLPKLHGSRPKLEGLLEKLAWFCTDDNDHTKHFGNSDPDEVRKYITDTNIKKSIAKDDDANPEALPRYKLSSAKVLRMWEKLVREQFVSFADA